MLSIEGLHSSYGSAEILRGVDLEVGDGEVVGLLGRNGMGKTTLVRSIAGLTPPAVHSGVITWQGNDLAGRAPFEISHLGIGLVPQGRRVFGSLGVEENLTMAARSADSAGWDLDRIYEFFPRLAERRSNMARNLSGGEQQMLAIGRALMTNPQMLLMDEPSEGLAPIVLEQIRDRLSELRAGDQSILLVEQNLALALAIADRIYILGEERRIAWVGSPEELKADSDVQEDHLGV